MEGREDDGVGRHAGAVPGARADREDARPRREKRARHRALRRRRIRRQESGAASSGSGVDGADHRPVGEGMFTRPGDFFFDTFGRAAVVKIASAVDGSGKITHWDHDIYAAGERSAELLYDVPNVRLRAFMGRGSAGARLHPFGTGPWPPPRAGPDVRAK